MYSASISEEFSNMFINSIPYKTRDVIETLCDQFPQNAIIFKNILWIEQRMRA